MARTIEIDQIITVSQLANELELPAAHLVAELFKNGIVATLNETIDFETATILVQDLGLDVTIRQRSDLIEKPQPGQRSNPNYQNRPPVVAVMGHVDHGKTSLIDRICQKNIAASESGGITQHISAHQASHQDRLITFLDTPGHAAFAAIRQHGAILTDLVLIVVAADEGVADQTLEVIRFSQKTANKIIVAVNKVDKPGADLTKVNNDLAQAGLVPEALKGETLVVPVSAKTGTGLDKLLDMILLVADTEDLKADHNGPGWGRIIDAYHRRGLGPTAVILVESGWFKKGDFLTVGSTYGRVRSLQTSRRSPIQRAGPSTPIIVSNLKDLPEFGDQVLVVETEKQAKRQAKQNQDQLAVKSSGMTSRELMRIIKRRSKVDELKLIIKADVKASLTVVSDGIKAFDNDEVTSRIIRAAVGPVTEKDVWLAHHTQADIYCFKVTSSNASRRLAAAHKVKISQHQVIYELLEAVAGQLESRLAPEIIITELAQLEVLEVFKTSRDSLICGGRLLSGPLSRPARVRIKRADLDLGTAELVSLKQAATKVETVKAGDLCGLGLKTAGRINLRVKDRLEFYRQTSQSRQLNRAATGPGKKSASVSKKGN